MLHAKEPMQSGRPTALVGTLCGAAMLAATQAQAGGLMLYEVGSPDIGLASAGYNARAQDASTVFTNPAGMTRLSGNQLLAGGQLLWSNSQYSIGSGTSPGLGDGNGGKMIGWDGWFAGGGGFFSYSVSPDLKLGLALTGNFGLGLEYDDDWVGRYYVQEATLVGLSIVPSIAYKVSDKLSLGASVNAMYGIFKNQVAINNIAPGYGDGRLKLEDENWGWGVNLGLLYEVDQGTRLGLTWTSQVDLDFTSPAEFSNLAPGLETVLGNRGLLNADIEVGIKVPQTVMGSFYTELNDRWALLGSVGWQEWSKFGQVNFGIDDTSNPTSLTKEVPFKDTWHGALGAQYQYTPDWQLSFGVAYDSGFQSSSNATPVAPVNSMWRFGFGAQNQLSKTTQWGFAVEYGYGGSLDTDNSGQLPVALGGRGDLIGSLDNISYLFAGVYGNWLF